MSVGERLTATSDPEVRARHIARYKRAFGYVKNRFGVWWDVACGDGYGTRIMPTQRRVGFDRDPASISAAWKNDHRGSYHVADVTEPHWWAREQSRPNVILCIETLEHLPREAQLRFIGNLAHVLKPQGVLVLACPIGDGPSVNPWHLHEPSADELRNMLRVHFPVVDIETEEYVSTSGPAVQAFCVCYAD